MDTDSQVSAEVPASRRWGALLLGAVVLVPFGSMLLTSSDSTEQLLGLGLTGLAVYLVAGAFVPRLLRFGGGDVPVQVAVPVMVGALKIAEGELIFAAVCLSIPLLFLAYDVIQRRRRAPGGPTCSRLPSRRSPRTQPAPGTGRTRAAPACPA